MDFWLVECISVPSGCRTFTRSYLRQAVNQLEQLAPDGCSSRLLPTVPSIKKLKSSIVPTYRASFFNLKSHLVPTESQGSELLESFGWPRPVTTKWVCVVWESFEIWDPGCSVWRALYNYLVNGDVATPRCTSQCSAIFSKQKQWSNFMYKLERKRGKIATIDCYFAEFFITIPSNC